MQKVHYKEHNDFRRSLMKMNSFGGKPKKAAKEVLALLGEIGHTDDPFKGFKKTNKGESRINKCIKYDLIGYARLITIFDAGVCLLCYVGTHDNCDAWLKKNQGLTLTASNNNEITSTPTPATNGKDYHIKNTIDATDKKLIDLLSSKYRQYLFNDLRNSQKKVLEKIDGFTSDEEIIEFIEELTGDNSKLAECIFNCIIHLKSDNVDNAKAVIDLYQGTSIRISELSDDDIIRLKDSEKIRSIPINSKEYAETLKIYSEKLNYKDWMLYMHPAQEIVAYEDFSGPSKLLGVSGSGKTCIVVKRAIYLAKKYPNEKILILTLNHPLASMISELVDTCTEDMVCRERIVVKPLFEILKELLISFEPNNAKLYNTITWKGNEHIDEIWHEYYRCDLNNYDARVIQPVHDSLISRGIYSEQYIRDEFDWIRSALPPSERDQYLSIERSGRSYPLDRNYRNLILKGMELWKKKMNDVGVVDHLGAANALFEHIDNIPKKYRCVLIDESQDIGNN